MTSIFKRSAPFFLLSAVLAGAATATARSQAPNATPKSNSAIRVVALVGCVTQEGKDWYLVQATGPITVPTADGRGQTGSGVTYDKARAEPVGKDRYRLMNMLKEFGVPEHKGQRVLVKGLLLGDEKDRRVNLVAFEEIAPACTTAK